MELEDARTAVLEAWITGTDARSRRSSCRGSVEGDTG